MDPMAPTPLWAQLGIAAALFVILLFVLRWISKLIEKIQADAKDERAEWQETIKEMTENAGRQLENNGSFQKRVEDAHGFQRTEHAKIAESLTEVATSLKSMNGGGRG